MKLYLYSFILLICFSNSTNAQSRAEKKVADAVEVLKNALISGNKDLLQTIAADKLSYGHSGGKIENKAAFIEAFASGNSDFITLNLTDQTISVSGKTAIVRHKLSAQTNDNGKAGTVNLNVLLIFQKQKGNWKLLARQAIKQPI